MRPTLVAEVSFAEWTDDDTLRHPSFLGLRADKRPTDVVREHPAANGGDASEEPPPRLRPPAKARAVADKNAVAGILVSNPDKKLYPEAQITKRDLALYYAALGEWMLPHVRGRPLTLLRCPNGWNEECFYQKKAEGTACPRRHLSARRAAESSCHRFRGRPTLPLTWP